MPAFVFSAGSLGDILATAGLAAQIVKALYNNKNLAKECEILAIELQSLQSVLLMVEFALQKYESTPLGAPLAHFVRPEVAQCHIVLKAFSNKVSECQKALSLTTIGCLWQKVMWAASDEAACLSGKISDHRLKLCTLLITLNSVGWMDSGSSHLGQRLCLQNGTRSIQGIKDNTIDVVDHLGETIPVPTLFCMNWEAFDHVIKGFSRNRIGHRYIEQGDYEIVQRKNDKVIAHSDLCRVKEGETVEMSIILRSKKKYLTMCPRCAFVNTHTPPKIGWLKCFHCSCLFRISAVLPPELGIDPDIPSENPQKEHSLPDGRPEPRDRQATMATAQHRDAVAQNMESETRITNIFRRISLETIRPLDMDDALTFLDAIKAQFMDQPYVYKRFLVLMQNFMDLKIDTFGVISRVVSLFMGHPSLIHRFNIFLSEGYHIELSIETFDFITVTTPFVTATLPTTQFCRIMQYTEKVQQQCDAETYHQFLNIISTWGTIDEEELSREVNMLFKGDPELCADFICILEDEDRDLDLEGGDSDLEDDNDGALDLEVDSSRGSGLME